MLSIVIEDYICIKVYDANTTISVCGGRWGGRENTLPTEAVIPVEENSGLELLEQNMFIIPTSSKRLHYISLGDEIYILD